MPSSVHRGDTATLHRFLYVLRRAGSYPASEETVRLSPRQRLIKQLPEVSVRGARPDTGNGGQQCRFHQSVPLRTISKRAVKSFSIACSGRNQLRSASGSQTQSWACAAIRYCASVFSSLSATPRKDQDRSGRLCAHRCTLVICDVAQVSVRLQCCKKYWIAVTDGVPSEDAITRFCFCWPGWVCVLVKSSH